MTIDEEVTKLREQLERRVLEVLKDAQDKKIAYTNEVPAFITETLSRELFALLPAPKVSVKCLGVNQDKREVTFEVTVED